VARLTRLETLHLEDLAWPLDAEGGRALARVLAGARSTLRELHACAKIPEETAEAVVSELRLLPPLLALRKLSVGGSSAGDACWLLGLVACAPLIEHLDGSATDFTLQTPAGAELFAQGLLQLQSLRELNCNLVTLDATAATAFAAALAGALSTSLETLDLSECMGVDDGMHLLWAGLSHATQLRRFIYSEEGGSTDALARALFAGLGQCRQLRFLDLWQVNDMTPATASTLAISLLRLEFLEELDVGGLGFTEDTIAAVMPAIACARHLRKVSLACNPLGDRGAEVLAAALPHMAALQDLEVFGCKLSVAGVNTVLSALPPVAGGQGACAQQRVVRHGCRDDAILQVLPAGWTAKGDY
jgi:Ran GTPase-activating protein (RanGAP) involved in mRNA processing and transport